MKRATRLTPPVPMWRQVADHLREQILDGTFPAGQVLPSEETLAAEYGVSRPVVRDGIKTLVSEGFVVVRRPHGNLVRDPFARPVRTERRALTSEAGQLPSDAGQWTDVEESTYVRTNATADHADLLAVEVGEPLLTRQATQQSEGVRRTHCLYVPFSIAENTPWADDPHIPTSDRVYAHFIEQGRTLDWTEYVRARMPVGDEQETLEIPPGTPLLVCLRLTRDAGNEQPLILEEARHRADQTEFAYPLH